MFRLSLFFDVKQNAIKQGWLTVTLGRCVCVCGGACMEWFGLRVYIYQTPLPRLDLGDHAEGADF